MHISMVFFLAWTQAVIFVACSYDRGSQETCLVIFHAEGYARLDRVSAYLKLAVGIGNGRNGGACARDETTAGPG